MDKMQRNKGARVENETWRRRFRSAGKLGLGADEVPMFYAARPRRFAATSRSWDYRDAVAATGATESRLRSGKA